MVKLTMIARVLDGLRSCGWRSACTYAVVSVACERISNLDPSYPFRDP